MSHVLTIPAGIILRTIPHEEHSPVVIRGWHATTLGLQPLDANEVSVACRTDSRTGRRLSPEPGIIFEPGFEIPRP